MRDGPVVLHPREVVPASPVLDTSSCWWWCQFPKQLLQPVPQVSTVPICGIPVNLAGRESSQLRTTPLAPNATTSGTVLPSALGLTPDSMKSRLSRSGQGPGTSLGKWNHYTKSWWLWPTSAQPPMEVRNTHTKKKHHFSSFSCLTVTTSLCWDALSLYTLW